MYKSDKQVITYHKLQPRSQKQNHSSVKNIQQIISYLIPYQANSTDSTYNNYQANRNYSAQQVLNPQSSLGYYYSQNRQLDYHQYRGNGQLQFINQPHRVNSLNSVQVTNG